MSCSMPNTGYSALSGYTLLSEPQKCYWYWSSISTCPLLYRACFFSCFLNSGYWLIVHTLFRVHRAGPRKQIYYEPAKVKAGIVTCGGLCPGLNDVIRQVSCNHAYCSWVGILIRFYFIHLFSSICIFSEFCASWIDQKDIQITTL